MLMTARILLVRVTAQLEKQSGAQNSLVAVWSLTTDRIKGTLTYGHCSVLSKHKFFVVTARAMGDTCCQVCSSVISIVGGEKTH